MRYLQFNDIYIDTHNQLLINANESFTLAPKVYDLLIYFCNNHDRVISKDELMDKVWSGTIVTDNAISRTLVKVRKVLGDDPKSPQYIVTVPKKGYRMVAQFDSVCQMASDQSEQVENQTSQSESSDNQVTINRQVLSAKPIVMTVICIAVLVIVATFVWWLSTSQVVEPIATKQIKPFTRDVGQELNPNVSPDLTKIAYTKESKNQFSSIIIEDLNSHQKTDITHAQGNLLRPVWSPQQDKLAFLYKQGDICTIYLANLENLSNKAYWQTISECGSQSYPSFVFSPDGLSFYFNDRQTTTNGYQVFHVDLAANQRTIVNQPITSGLGNYSFDLSSDGERLVLLNSEFYPTTRIYTLDIKASKLTKTAQLDYLMRSVRWSHDNQTLIHPAPHPAYDIWQSDLAGNQLSVFASNTSRVKHLSRINNGHDFAFVSYLLNRDIFFLDNKVNTQQGGQTKQPLDNSSVMDYLPAIANHSGQYAFVSKRATTAEVYLANKRQPELNATRLTFFNTPIKFYQLAFSPNDSQLLIQGDNQLFVANTKSLDVLTLPIKNMAISAASWVNETRIIFSTIKNNEWQMMEFDLDSQTLSQVHPDFQAGVYSQLDNHYYLFNQQQAQLMRVSENGETVEAMPIACEFNFKRRKLTLATTNTGIICIAKQKLTHYQFSNKQQQVIHHLPTHMDFSITRQGSVFSELTNYVADIMHTVSE